MGFKQILLAAALAVGAAAQVVPYTQDNHSVQVHVPTDTASSGSGPIYFRLTAPSGTTWAAVGQGTYMRNAQFFVIYADGAGNVTLSPRGAANNVQPRYSSSIQATLLAGSGVQSDGSLVANIRCDSCLSWATGTMSATSTSADWIMAYQQGTAINSSNQSATITKHDSRYNFILDLTAGTGNQNTIITGSTSAAPPNNPSTSSSTSSEPPKSANPNKSPFPHGIIMSVLFVGLFPLASLTMYLPSPKRVRFIHAPLQMVNLILLIAGLATGVIYGEKSDKTDGYHQTIGYIVFFALFAVQPAMGIYQHRHYNRTGGRSRAGLAHQWLGRGAIVLGIINGGLGWNLTDTRAAFIPYGVIAAVVCVAYASVALFSWIRKSRSSHLTSEDIRLQSQRYKVETGGVESQSPPSSRRH